MTDASHGASAEGLAKLGYVYHPRSFATLSLVEAARGVCELVWIVDTSQPEVASMTRLLRRFGDVVDIAGTSPEAAAALVREMGLHGILALADDTLRLTAEMAADVGLNFLSRESARRLTDKHAQRDALAAAGLEIPRNRVVTQRDAEEGWSAVADSIRFPAVLKPRRGEGSRDTLPVRSLRELATLWSTLQSSDERVRDFVLEEYIADAPGAAGGDGFAGYVSVESFVCAGKINHLAITGRMPPAEPFRETGFFIPSALSAETQSAVLRVATHAAEAMGVHVGCLHTEIKLTPLGPVVIEVNGRIGGGVPEMLEAATGVRMLSIAMRLALGQEVAMHDMPSTNCLAYLFYVQAPNDMGRVRAIEGLEELRAVRGVEEIVLNRGPGQVVDWREGNHGHVFSVFGRARDHEELRRIDQLIKTLVRIDGD